MADAPARTSVQTLKPEYREVESDEGGANAALTDEQQAALYFARKRRRESQS